MSMCAHESQKMKTDVWLTPPEIVDALGRFDLDPCSPVNRPWPTAAMHYTPLDDGLAKPWFGRVWLNPPYSREATKWLARMAEHGDGIALIFARTETAWFWSSVWQQADAALFLRGRIYFHHADGTMAKANAGAPSVLAAYGTHNAEILRNANIEGAFVTWGKP